MLTNFLLLSNEKRMKPEEEAPAWRIKINDIVGAALMMVSGATR